MAGELGFRSLRREMVPAAFNANLRCLPGPPRAGCLPCQACAHRPAARAGALEHVVLRSSVSYLYAVMFGKERCDAAVVRGCRACVPAHLVLLSAVRPRGVLPVCKREVLFVTPGQCHKQKEPARCRNYGYTAAESLLVVLKTKVIRRSMLQSTYRCAFWTMQKEPAATPRGREAAAAASVPSSGRRAAGATGGGEAAAAAAPAAAGAAGARDAGAAGGAPIGTAAKKA